MGALVRDGWWSLWRRPRATLGVVATALGDALCGAHVPLSRRPKLLLQCLGALALDTRLAGRQVDHVHAHLAHVPTSIAMYFAMLRKIPFSFTGHAADLFRDYSLLPAKARRAAFVACISHWHRHYYQTCVPELSVTRLPIVRCGVAPAGQLPDGNQDTRENSPPTRLLAVGRLVEKKGFDLLIRALGALRRQGVAFHCQVIGEGPERSALKRLSDEENLGASLEFLGARDHHDVLLAMQHGDLLVLPCRPTASGDRDGIPVVLMEAMARGIAVVAGDLPTIRELIRHGETGWLVPPGNVPELSRALTTLIADPDGRRRLGASGRGRIAAEFSLSRNVDRLLDAVTAARQMSAESPPALPCFTRAS